MAVNPSTFHPIRLHRALAPRAPPSFSDRASRGPNRRLGAAPRIVLLRSRKHSSPSSEGFEPSLRTDYSGAPIGSPAHRSSASAIDFLTLCHRLKTTKRKGWINQGIDGPESIADHMYRMALMALIADDLPGLDRERCIKIAIVHDIAEAIVGDITPADGVPKEEKSRREQAALDEMCQVLGGGMRAEEIKELWAEYENNSSVEANLVKDLDKVELILQALEYEMGNASTYCLSMCVQTPRTFALCVVTYSLLLFHVGQPIILPELTMKKILYITFFGKLGKKMSLEFVTASKLKLKFLTNISGEPPWGDLKVMIPKHEMVLDEFFLSTAGKFQTEIGKSWAAEILSRRNSRLSNGLN